MNFLTCLLQLCWPQLIIKQTCNTELAWFHIKIWIAVTDPNKFEQSMDFSTAVVNLKAEGIPNRTTGDGWLLFVFRSYVVRHFLWTQVAESVVLAVCAQGCWPRNLPRWCQIGVLAPFDVVKFFSCLLIQIIWTNVKDKVTKK